MENIDEAVLKRLISEDPDFKDAFEKHKEYNIKIDRMEKREFLSAEDELEMKELKKKKLTLKDKLEKMVEAVT